MENPIKAIESIPGELQNWINRQVQRAEVQAKIDALRLIDWAAQQAGDAAHTAIQEQITSLKDQLDKL